MRRRVEKVDHQLRPVPRDLNVWKLDPSDAYELIDKPAERMPMQLGLPNIFAHEKEYNVARLMIVFDNHPTHWLIFNFFNGDKTEAENGLAFSAIPKSEMNKADMLLRLTIEGKKMQAAGTIQFSQIPSLPQQCRVSKSAPTSAIS
ncbi:MAG TPA: hypothetical protein VHD32_17845 [Candidatus Didemnitutus sp.]|nr:hypothetical protein [Candidatus Didemnitutus sp.]